MNVTISEKLKAEKAVGKLKEEEAEQLHKKVGGLEKELECMIHKNSGLEKELECMIQKNTKLIDEKNAISSTCEVGMLNPCKYMHGEIW